MLLLILYLFGTFKAINILQYYLSLGQKKFFPTCI